MSGVAKLRGNKSLQCICNFWHEHVSGGNVRYESLCRVRVDLPKQVSDCQVQSEQQPTCSPACSLVTIDEALCSTKRMKERGCLVPGGRECVATKNGSRWPVDIRTELVGSRTLGWNPQAKNPTVRTSSP